MKTDPGTLASPCRKSNPTSASPCEGVSSEPTTNCFRSSWKHLSFLKVNLITLKSTAAPAASFSQPLPFPNSTDQQDGKLPFLTTSEGAGECSLFLSEVDGFKDIASSPRSWYRALVGLCGPGKKRPNSRDPDRNSRERLQNPRSTTPSSGRGCQNTSETRCGSQATSGGCRGVCEGISPIPGLCELGKTLVSSEVPEVLDAGYYFSDGF